MINNVGGGIRLPRILLNRIIQRTDGIPLIVEELTRAVLNSGALEQVGDRFKIRKTLPEPLVPATIQDSLRERLDRLGSAKSVAQVASVLGREFTLKGLQHVSGTAAAPSPPEALNVLAASGLIHQRAGGSVSNNYVFNHAMMQEEAYASHAAQETKRLLSTSAPALGSPVRSRVAKASRLPFSPFHFSRAELHEKAAMYWLEAGKGALRRWHKWRRSPTSMLAPNPPHIGPSTRQTFEIEIELQLHLAMSYIGLEGLVGPAYRCRLSPCPRARAPSHGSLRERVHGAGGASPRGLLGHLGLPPCSAWLDQLALPSGRRPMEIALMSHVALTTSNFYLGNLVEGAPIGRVPCSSHYRERAHRHLVNLYQHDPEIIALVFGGHIYWLLGQVPPVAAPAAGRPVCWRTASDILSCLR